MHATIRGHDIGVSDSQWTITKQELNALPDLAKAFEWLSQQGLVICRLVSLREVMTAGSGLAIS